MNGFVAALIALALAWRAELEAFRRRLEDG
jgi:hypothetical protein